MLDLVLRVGLRHLGRRPLRTLLTILAVALGIGLSVSIAIINRSVLSSFRESVAALAGTSALTVTAGDVGFAEEKLDDIERVPGVKSAIPRVEAWGYLAGDESGTETLYILGIDMLREQAVRSYQTGSGEVMDDPLVFLNEPDSVILTRTFAAAHGLHIGSALPLATATGQVTLTVRGLLDAEGPAKAYGGAVALMDIDGARVMLGKDGKIDAVDIVPRAGVDVGVLAGALRAALGPSFVVEPPQGYARQLEQLVQPFQASLTFFGTIALVVGLFLVANSTSMSVAERQKEIGVLRALGATRTQVFSLLLAECALIGTVGALAGAYLGRLLASRMVGDVAESMTHQLSMKITMGELGFDRGVVLRAVALGTGTAIIAGLLPIVRATRIPATTAMRAQVNAGDRSSDGGKASHIAAVLGAGCLSCVLLTIAVPGLGESAPFASLAQAAGVLGVALVSPSLVQLAIRAMRRLLLGGTDVVPRLATENVIRYRRRTQTNVIGLTLGLLFVMLIAGISHSMKDTVMQWFTINMRHDLLVSSKGKVMQNAAQPIREELGAELADVPGIRQGARAVEGIRFLHVTYEGHTIALKAYDEPDPARHYWLFDARDRTRDEMGRALYHSQDPTVLVSTNFVLHFGKKTRDSITLDTPSGPTSFRVVGVVTDFASPEGVVYLARERYRQIWNDPLVSGFGLYVAPGADPVAVRTELDRRFGRSRNLMFILNDEFRAEFTSAIDRSFAFADALEWAALFVALAGIFNTLTIGILERTRELGMMRGLGMQRSQLARMILLEALLLGAATALLAVVLGGALGYWLIARSLPTTLGWVLHYTLPWRNMALIFGTGVAVAGIAGAYPAWRASRIEIVEALGYE